MKFAEFLGLCSRSGISTAMDSLVPKCHTSVDKRNSSATSNIRLQSPDSTLTARSVSSCSVGTS